MAIVEIGPFLLCLLRETFEVWNEPLSFGIVVVVDRGLGVFGTLLGSDVVLGSGSIIDDLEVLKW